jgi:hypothetical protein
LPDDDGVVVAVVVEELRLATDALGPPHAVTASAIAMSTAARAALRPIDDLTNATGRNHILSS